MMKKFKDTQFRGGSKGVQKNAPGKKAPSKK